MPEAVIVDTIRTPIGRAFKGSLASLRPEEMGAFVVDQLLERNPERRPGPDRGRLLRRRHAARPAGLQHGPDHLAALGEAAAERQRRHRLPLLLLQPRRDPPRRQRDQGGRGRRLPGGRGRVGQPLQRSLRAGPRRRSRPEPDRRERPAERLHRHGHHRRQRRQQVRRQPRGHGQVRPALAGTGGQIAGGWLLRPRDRPGHPGRRHRGRQGRRPARLLDPGEAGRTRRGLRRRRRGHRRQLLPAERRRGSGPAHERHEGQGAGPEAARPDHHRRHLRQRAGADGRRPDRRGEEGARPGRDDDRRHRQGRAERGLRRPGDPDHGRNAGSTKTS